MRLADAVRIMESAACGYRVSFEKREGCILGSGHFPERDETPFTTEEAAWSMAARFAATAPPEYVNIYVVRADDWTPVPGYQSRLMRRYPDWEALARKGRP